MSEDIEIIDAHHHFWDLNKNYYPFLSDKIDSDFFLGNYVIPSDFFSDNLPIINSVHTGWDGSAHIPIAWKKSSYKIAKWEF